MDILTVIGLLLGAAVVGGVMQNTGILSLMWDINAAILVFGGAAASVLIAYPWSEIRCVPSAVRIIFFPRRMKNFVQMIEELVTYSGIAKKEGIDALSGRIPTMSNRFMKRAFTFSLSGMAADMVKENLEREVMETQQRHQKVGSIFRALGTFTPIFGLLGTLIGVVTVLRSLGGGGMEQQGLGEAFGKMQIAVTTTFYGIFGANFLFLPTAIKLNEYSSEEILLKTLMIETVYSIQNGEFPMVLAKKLDAFVSETLKARGKGQGND